MQKPFILKFTANRTLQYSAAILIWVAALLISISVGTVHVPISTIITILVEKGLPFLSFTKDYEVMYESIVFDIRLPRVILAALVGSALAVSGVAFQGLLRNPLADPYVLGVSSGASVGAVFVLFVGLTIPFLGSFTLPLVSIGAAIISVLAVLAFANLVDRSLSLETLILTGIIFSSFLGSFISLMIALTGDELRQIIQWLLGSVSMRGWPYVKLLLPFFIVGVTLLLLQGKELNALTFGEHKAKQLGVNVERRKLLILLSASILTGAAVAVSGTIGFVGLVIPHICRKLVGTDHTHLTPISIFIGGAFLMLSDLLARTIIAPAELPIGVLTSLVGAPVFAFILIQQRKKGRA
ncbi:corrinoid ABC transporter permease [Pontibacillus halophilus JSM 076056 = DSM 19796]|uniref:Corrinoid ABC transporter permease n=1 Tax=Pontibacillus halophilus JSM 076056 = DSM 19796 TaxID=1385510 RepID=A0A0A5GIA6_9BACI|nr:iron ABC transporter permease [Pontibacillus halophilus]KGX90860.1 corrinoid ABC transporter permease [Pontibacillus halophilus JSM 076056 = DSM 19796]